MKNPFFLLPRSIHCVIMSSAFLKDIQGYLSRSQLFNPLDHFYVPVFHAHKVALDTHALDISLVRKFVLFFVYSFGGSWTAHVLNGDKLPVLDNLIILYTLVFVVSGIMHYLAREQQKYLTIYRYILAIGDEWVKVRSIQRLHKYLGTSQENHNVRAILLASLGGYGGGLWDYIFNISKQHNTSILDVEPVDFIWTSIAPNIWSSIAVSTFLGFKKDVIVASGVKIAIFLSILIRNIQDVKNGNIVEEKPAVKRKFY
eukprot:NODE_24_length_41419_cov_0.818780.p22 type:complete len:257 gc:universal NODE_24_length_41419_cov_0.818780:26604-27374(+)